MNGTKGFLLLTAGTILVAAAHLRFGIGALAWVAPVPFLLYLRHSRGVAPRFMLAGALMVAWSLATLKIITEPLSPIFALFYGVPIGLLQAIAYLGWDRLKNKRGALWVFPALMAGVEWIQYSLTPLGSWGAAAYSQLENLPLLQLASLFGIPAISFVIHLVASLVERWISGNRSAREALAALALVVAVHGFGALRIGFGEGSGRDTVVAAAVGTDSTVAGLPLPEEEVIEREKQALFDRTSRAAEAGAAIVVWPEAAIGIDPEQEANWMTELSVLAEELQIELVASYVVPVSVDPFQFENKYLWYGPDGELDQIYFKHEPVPGEPAVKGTEPITAVATSFGSAAGAICYDYDFPWIARDHARLGVNLVAVPASDWRGIDPLHADMARLRAIEGGHSIVRSTRWGMSIGIDPYGRVLGRMSDLDDNGKVLIVSLPVEEMTTLYSRIGDTAVLLFLLFPAFSLTSNALLRKRRERTPELSGGALDSR